MLPIVVISLKIAFRFHIYLSYISLNQLMTSFRFSVPLQCLHEQLQ